MEAINDTENIDVDKAIKDMHKETILEPYKFFVSCSNPETDSDGKDSFEQ